MKGKTRRWTSCCFVSPFHCNLLVIYPAGKGKNGRGVRRVGRWYVDKNF